MKLPFTVILRTFGKDLDEVITEIEEHPEHMQFKYRGKYTGPQLSIQNQIKTNDKEAFAFFVESGENFAIQDDWSHWNKDGERGRSGKTFLYDKTSYYLSLFFDDNITGGERDIVRPCEITGDTASNQELLEEYLFPVLTKEAMLHDNYYVDKVLLALEKAKK